MTANDDELSDSELCIASENDDVTSLIDEKQGESNEINNGKTNTVKDENSQKEKPLMTIKQMTRDRAGMMMYLVKPIVMMSIGSLVLVVGIVLTVFHFLFEGDPLKDEKNPPYFTFGPVVFALGTVTVIYALVWFSIKREKWLSGNAAPIIAAVTAAIAIPSTAMATVVPHHHGNTKNHVEEQSVV